MTVLVTYGSGSKEESRDMWLWLLTDDVLAKVNTGEIRKVLGKNAGEWTRRVEISKEEIPGSKRSMYGYIYTDLFQALKGECLALCSHQMGL